MVDEAKIKVTLDTDDAKRRIKKARTVVTRGGILTAESTTGVAAVGAVGGGAVHSIIERFRFGKVDGFKQTRRQKRERIKRQEEHARNVLRGFVRRFGSEELLKELELEGIKDITKQPKGLKSEDFENITKQLRKKRAREKRIRSLQKARRRVKEALKVAALPATNPIQTFQNVTVAASTATGAIVGGVDFVTKSVTPVAAIAAGFEKLEPFIRRIEPGVFVEDTSSLGNIIASISGNLSGQSKALFETSRIRGAATLFGGSFPSATTTKLQSRLAGVRAKQSIQKSNIRAAIAERTGPEFAQTILDITKNNVSH